jgi:tRNA(Ile)-lysidine synthase
MTLESDLLARLQAWRAAPVWYVAFSGGLDSTVLLHLMTRLCHQQELPPLRAVHIHHGLQDAADAWPEHCRQLCSTLGVPLLVRSVQVDPGASLERAAREARYRAFAAILQEQDLLLLAQHQDDQAETVLYRLLRGAGVRGLSAMAESRALGGAKLLRPFLDVPRRELLAYAQEHALPWVEDPSNSDTQWARNFLRREIFPRLRQHWPQVSAVLARCARHQAQAQVLLDELAELDHQACQARLPMEWLNLPCLNLEQVRQLSDARQANLLRYWLAAHTRLPDSRHWQGWRNLRDACGGANPRWRLEQGELRRHGALLLWCDQQWREPWDDEPQAWRDPQVPLVLPGNGRVWFEGVPPQGVLSIGYRQGGERIALPGRGRRDLKRLLQEAGVPELVRARLPLLLCDGQVQAVAEIMDCAGGSRLRWRLR